MAYKVSNSSAVHVLSQETTLDATLPEVFEFFASAENLQKLTPKSLEFKILSPLPIVMRAGALIDYRLRLMGVPFRWRTEITTWQPPFQFIDSQLRGPYRLWLHQHRFESVGDKTRMFDRVEFLSPGWIFEPAIFRLFVKPRVAAIFRHRNSAMREIFGTDSCEEPRFTDEPRATLRVEG